MNTNANTPSVEVDTEKRRVLFYRCGSEAEMVQLARQRLAEVTSAIAQLRGQKDKPRRRQLNRERYALLQWLTGGGVKAVVAWSGGKVV